MMVFDVVIKTKYFGVTFIIEALVQSLHPSPTKSHDSVEMCYVKASHGLGFDIMFFSLYLCSQFKFDHLFENINALIFG